MVEWKLVGQQEASFKFNDYLFKTSDFTIFQSFEWGEYKRGGGWEVKRYFACKKDTIVGGAQIFIKKIPFNSAFIWIPGGPCVKSSSNSKSPYLIVKDLIELVVSPFRNYAVRFHSHETLTAEDSYTLSKYFYQPYIKINSGYSVNLSLLENNDSFIKAFKRKHRYYYKQSLKESISWKYGHSDKLLKDMFILTAEMNINKNVSSVFGYGIENIREMQKVLGEKINILVGYYNERPITSCLVLNIKDKSYYLLAASGEEGRRISASYAQIGELSAKLRESGIRLLDFGGVNPYRDSCSGVDHFKMGFGGELRLDLGEWEASSSLWFKCIVHQYINFKLNLIK